MPFYACDCPCGHKGTWTHKATGKTGPYAAYAIQGFCPSCAAEAKACRRRFFATLRNADVLNAALLERDKQREGDLEAYWPREEIPYGERTHIKDPLPKHGYKRWTDLFNPRQLLVHATLDVRRYSAEGLPEADLQVIRRGKALEYFAKHYGKVYVDEGKPISVLEALAGINQLLNEEIGGEKDPPPVTAEPFTRQFLIKASWFYAEAPRVRS